MFGVRRLASCASLLLICSPLAAAQDTARVAFVRSLLAEAGALDPRAASPWLETSALLEIGALDVLGKHARAGRLSTQDLAGLARVFALRGELAQARGVAELARSRAERDAVLAVLPRFITDPAVDAFALVDSITTAHHRLGALVDIAVYGQRRELLQPALARAREVAASSAMTEDVVALRGQLSALLRARPADAVGIASLIHPAAVRARLLLSFITFASDEHEPALLRALSGAADSLRDANERLAVRMRIAYASGDSAGAVAATRVLLAALRAAPVPDQAAADALIAVARSLGLAPGTLSPLLLLAEMEAGASPENTLEVAEALTQRWVHGTSGSALDDPHSALMRGVRDAGWRAAARLSPPLADSARARLLIAIARTAPAAALERVDELAAERDRDRVRLAATELLLRDRPDEARAVGAAIAPTPTRTPPATLPDPVRNEILPRAAELLPPDELAAWARAHGSPSARADALRAVAIAAAPRTGLGGQAVSSFPVDRDVRFTPAERGRLFGALRSTWRLLPDAARDSLRGALATVHLLHDPASLSVTLDGAGLPDIDLGFLNFIGSEPAFRAIMDVTGSDSVRDAAYAGIASARARDGATGWLTIVDSIVSPGARARALLKIHAYMRTPGEAGVVVQQLLAALAAVPDLDLGDAVHIGRFDETTLIRLADSLGVRSRATTLARSIEAGLMGRPGAGVTQLATRALGLADSVPPPLSHAVRAAALSVGESADRVEQSLRAVTAALPGADSADMGHAAGIALIALRRLAARGDRTAAVRAAAALSLWLPSEHVTQAWLAPLSHEGFGPPPDAGALEDLWRATLALLQPTRDSVRHGARPGQRHDGGPAGLGRRTARHPRAPCGVAVPRFRERTLTAVAAEAGTIGPGVVTTRPGVRRPYCAVDASGSRCTVDASGSRQIPKASARERRVRI